MKYCDYIVRGALLALMFTNLNLLHGATIVVTSTADSGPGSLRQAILDANADTSPGDVDIEFNIPGSGVHTISPVLQLPAITRAVTIDGYTQPGASPNTLADADDAVLLIELSGASLADPSFSPALFITASGCTVRGLVINRFDSAALDVTGVWLHLSDNHVIEGNFFGTDPSGLVSLGNYEGVIVHGANNIRIGGLAPAERNIFGGSLAGIDFFGGGLNNVVVGNFLGVGADGSTTVSNIYGILIHNSPPTQIGGAAPGARNVISGNANGVWVNNFGGNVFEGNFIGTDASGTLARGNLTGIALNESPTNRIGGTASGERNVISGNRIGVGLGGTTGGRNVVVGNFIGTDVTGVTILANVDYGVYAPAPGNTIGGTAPGAGNVIAGSTFAGVAVYGPDGTNNAILGNSIFGNGLGIDLGFDFGATPNDASDTDDGANHFQNFPGILATAIGSPNMSVDYRVDSTAASSAYPLTVEFFIADAAGQGRTFLHRATYSTPQATEHITFVPAVMPVEGDKIVATATDGSGNTSEFPIEPVVVIEDTTPPTISCPANVTAGCSGESLTAVTYPAPTASDNLDPNPTVTCTPASGIAGFAVGINTVVCTAVDSLGNSATCSFTVTRAALGFTGFLPPIGGEVRLGTGGSFADPVRAFKFGSTIPVKFRLHCGGSAILTGVHTLRATKYSSIVDSDTPIDATPTDAATTGNQFRLTDAASGDWHFNLNTQPLSIGTWKLTATLSDGTTHEVWITIKK